MTTGTNETARLLGPLGGDVMHVLWSTPEPQPVRAVLDQLNHGRAQPLAYTTVMTVLCRLAERGAAHRTRAGRGYTYAPAIKDTADLAVRDLLHTHGDAAVVHFVDQVRANPRLRRRLRQLLDQPGPN